MNSTIIFPQPPPELKLPRTSEKWAATLDEERRRLQEDLDALREREANLREYEARLRAWQAEIDAGRIPSAVIRPVQTPMPFHRPSSVAPFADDTSLQAAWEKLHRARELLEAEQMHLRDDRTAIREKQESIKQHEALLAEREAAVAQREALVTAATGNTAHPIAGEHTMSTVTRLTRAPFDMARSVFGRKVS
jgi:hypothetical protein